MNLKTEQGYLNPYLSGFILGLILFLAFFLTGNGLGASGSLNRVVIAVEDFVSPEHVNTTPSHLTMAGGDKNPFDHWLMPLLLGTILGGFLSGKFSGRVKVETSCGIGISPKKRWLLALLGGTIMGFGARFARGCTSGQALSGGAVLSTGSWAFMFAVFAGAYAFAWFVRKYWRDQL